jgi:transcription termination/antitermination protein NusG
MSVSQSAPVPSGEGPEPSGVIPVSTTGLWYVAHTRARNEKALVTDFSRMGISSYLPLVTRETRSRRTRRVSHSVVPVFPSYVFFIADEEQRYLALRTNRIAKLLIVPEQAQFVAELDRVRLLLQCTQDFAVVQRLGTGDWVRIMGGPLTGLEGTVVRIAGKWRLSLNVTTLGQSILVEVDRDQVERIDPPAWSAGSSPSA